MISYTKKTEVDAHSLVFLAFMRHNSKLAYEPLPVQEEWQSAYLPVLISYLQQNSPFYRRLFATHGIMPDQIKSVSDLRFLPTTTKSDIQQFNREFICVKTSEIREYTATSGTLGNPVTIALTENDLKRLAYNEQQSFLCADGKPGDIYQLMLTLDRQFMAGMAYYTGIRALGAASVRTGPGLPAMQWETITRLQSNSLVTVPSFLLKMIEFAQIQAINMAYTAVEKAICIGEGLRKENFEPNTLGEKILQQWPLKLYNTYAATEMQTAFTECHAGMGGHHQPDLLILEILDDGGDQLGEGEYGEVTITTIGVEGMPLLRYRTGDICCFYEASCICGRKSKRLSPVMGRKKQMIKYRGTTFYPPAIFEILNGISFIREYVVEVSANELGTDDLTLHLHTTLPSQECTDRIRPFIQSALRAVPVLQFHSAASIQQMQFPANGRKQVRFIDNRLCTL